MSLEQFTPEEEVVPQTKEKPLVERIVEDATKFWEEAGKPADPEPSIRKAMIIANRTPESHTKLLELASEVFDEERKKNVLKFEKLRKQEKADALHNMHLARYGRD